MVVALRDLHNFHGLSHHDLTPRNIIFNPLAPAGRRIAFVDFESAHVLAAGALLPNLRVGTADTMPMESLTAFLPNEP